MDDGLVGALIGGGITLLATVLTQAATWRRVRSDRAHERRRDALIAVQDAALALRDELRGYGARVQRDAVASLPAAAGPRDPGEIVLDLPSSSAATDRARGRLDVCGVRLDPTGPAADVGPALDSWRETAELHFLGDSDVTATAEQQAWTGLHLVIAAALHA